MASDRDDDQQNRRESAQAAAGGAVGRRLSVRRGLGTLGQSVERITTPAMRRRGFAEAAIVTRWGDIVGRPLSDHARPSRVVFARGERRHGTLHLVVTGAFAPEVQHLAPQIIERINGFFGYAAIARLELHHGRATWAPQSPARKPGGAGAPRRAPDAAVASAIGGVADPDLREALERLADARAARETESD